MKKIFDLIDRVTDYGPIRFILIPFILLTFLVIIAVFTVWENLLLALDEPKRISRFRDPRRYLK